MSFKPYPLLRPIPFCLIVVSAIVFATLPLASQVPPLDEQTAGRTFLVAFPDTTSNLLDSLLAPPLNDVIALYLYSAVDNRVEISGNGYHRVVDLREGKFTVVKLNDSASRLNRLMVSEPGMISRNTFRVHAREPIVLYCYMFTRFGAEAWTPLAVERWGMEYFAAAHPGEIAADMAKRDIYAYERRNKMAPAEILVIAAYDNTRVTITPNGRVNNYDSTAVTLNAGEAYLVQSWVDITADSSGALQPDFGGSHVTANRPIGVVSGNTRASLFNERPAVTSNSMKNMLIEWLAPVDQFGTEFVSTPTWDTRHLTGEFGERVQEKRSAEYVRVYSSAKDTKVLHRRDSTRVDTATVQKGFLAEERVLVPTPHHFRTSKPAQVMMASSAVIRFNGTISGTPGSQSFDAWGPYMVEVTPREQWTSFAPYYVPSEPEETRHYLNVVADTNALDRIYMEDGAPFEFNRGKIPGTDLMWGTMPVTSGGHYLEALEGTKFYAVQYGIRQGLEAYRPEVKGQTFAEYRELIGLAYGYALAPGRKIMRDPDELKIEHTSEPCWMNVKITATNPNPSGLLSAVLDPTSVNARIEITNPAGWNDVAGLTRTELKVLPINPLRDASATLVITDRTGKSWTLPYSYSGDSVAVSPTRKVDFGELASGQMKDSVITITNPLGHAVPVSSIVLRLGTQAFSIVSTEPALPATLPPGGTIRVVVRAAPAVDKNLYRDTLRVRLTCAELRVPLQIGPVPPCIMVGDLDFGEVKPNSSRTLSLTICNDGHGSVSFNSPVGGPIITWSGEGFSIDQQSLQALKQVTLEADECITLPVTFRATKEGEFTVVARVWASTRQCRDTSIWRGVATMSAGITMLDPATGLVASITPNPTSGQTAIAFTLGAPEQVKLSIHDAAGRELAKLLDARLQAGEHAALWDASGVPAGAYFCRLVVGERAQTLPVVIRR